MPLISGQTQRALGSQSPSPPPFPLLPSLWSLCPPSFPPSVIGGGLAPSLPSCPPPPRPSILPSRCDPSLSLPPCCGSRSQSLGLFASLFVPCLGEPALSSAVVGQTAQAHCSPPPSPLSTSGHLMIRVAARGKTTWSSANRRVAPLHWPCIALASPLPASICSHLSMFPLLLLVWLP